MKNLYSVNKVEEDLYQIVESISEDHPAVNMYLAVGEEQAILFDSGFGVFDTLREEVEKLTDRPVICVVGHGHPDHAGAAELFDKVYMNSRDEALLPVSLSYDRRMNDVFGRGAGEPEQLAYAKDHIVDPGGEHFQYEEMKAGDTFTTGRRSFTVYEIPGHTPGSIALLSDDGEYALISDAAGPRTAVLNQTSEKGAAVRNYRDGLREFLEASGENTRFWSGHMKTPMPHHILEDMCGACTEVLDGDTANDVESTSHFAKRQAASGKKMTEHRSGTVILVYDANNI